MTEQKTVHLNVNEWKAVCLQDLKDLYQFLDSVPFPNDEVLGKVDQHMARWAVLMRSWKLCGEPKEPVQAEGGESETVKETPAANGAEKPRKGGWPKGKPRKPKADAEATAH